MHNVFIDPGGKLSIEALGHLLGVHTWQPHFSIYQGALKGPRSTHNPQDVAETWGAYQIGLIVLEDRESLSGSI